MVSVLASVNLKGGVGKTAIAVNFAAYCGSKGAKTLLVDLDPQTNATFSCITVDEWEKHAAEHGSVADLLGSGSRSAAEGAEHTFLDVVRQNVFPNVDLIPSHLELFLVDLDIGGHTARETKLKRALKDHKDSYQIIVCDCPPNLTIPTQNALAFATHYVIPISPDYLSAIGVGILRSRISTLSEELENSLSLAGLIISRKGRPAKHRDESIDTLRTRFGGDVLDTELTERTAVKDATAVQKSIFDQDGNGPASTEFRNVSDEILNRMGINL